MKAVNETALDRLSSAVPKSATKRRFSAIDVSVAISDFLNEEFRGLAELATPVKEPGSVNLSAEHLAYFLKLLLKAVDGKSFLSIDTSIIGERFIIDIRSDGIVTLDLSQRSSLNAAANGAGFDLSISQGCITLSSKERTAVRAMFVYAGGMQRFKRILSEIFFNF